MASLTPFVGLNSGDKPWVEQISKTLKTQLAVTTETPPVSIFEIPKTLKDENLEAYVPQRIGLGPIHHFQPLVYPKMEQNKLTSVKRVLKPYDQIQDPEDKVVQQLREIIPVISACYDVYLDTDEDTLAWLFAIDGLFLIDQLGAFADHQLAIEAKDLIKLENQIPLIVLKEILKALSSEDYNLDSKFQAFCESHSPFLLSEEKINFSRVNHLLDYMYHSIVNNETSISKGVEFKKSLSSLSEKSATVELVEAVIQAAELIPGAKPFLEIVESINENLSETTEKTPMVEEVKVPSVSELRDVAGVKFQVSPRDGGIRNINFVQEGERACYLPVMTLNYDSEVILRNLVAYEQLIAKNSLTGGFGLEITEYVDFLCGIIDSAKDVKLLREEKIIEGDLGDEEIVKLFNGIGRSLGNMSGKSELRKTVGQLNKVYESMPSVWVQRMVEKQVRSSAKAITFLVSISSTLFLIREVYLKAYGSNPPQMLVHFLSEQMESLSSLVQ